MFTVEIIVCAFILPSPSPAAATTTTAAAAADHHRHHRDNRLRGFRRNFRRRGCTRRHPCCDRPDCWLHGLNCHQIHRC